MFTYRRFFQVICTILIIGSFHSCNTAKRQIAFSAFGDPAEFAAYQEIVATFAETHPEIEVELRDTPSQSEYLRRLATDFSSGDPADVVLLDYRRFATFAKTGALESLEPYLAESDLISETDFFPTTLEVFRWNETLWCIPQNVSSLVLYYNRDLFDQAGLAYPQPGWTWAEFLGMARALTLDLDGDGQIDQYGAGITPNFYRLAPFIWQNGGQLVDDPQMPTRLALDEPAALEALTWFVNLQVKEGVVPNAVAEATESGENRFLNGRLAMYFNSRRGVPAYRTIKNFAWDVAPLPRSRQAAGILHSDGYCLASASQNKADAWTFIEFANSVQGQTVVAKTGRTVPSLISVAESPVFLEPDQPPANSRVYIDTVPTLGHVPIMSTWIGIEETVSKEIERAFYGQAEIAEAVETAIELSKPFFEQASQE